MSETCAVCKKGKGPKICEVCGFSDNSSVNRSFPIPEDTKYWIETVVKPYRMQWEAERMKKEAEAKVAEAEKRAKEAEAKLTEVLKNSEEAQRIAEEQKRQVQQQTYSQTQPTSSPTTKFPLTKSIVILLIISVSVVIIVFLLNYDDAKAHFERGLTHYNKNDYDKAIEDFTAALKIKPDDPTYLNHRGYAYSGFASYGYAYYYDLAIVDYTTALEIDPNNPIYLNNRGNAYYKKGDYDKAIADFEVTLQIDPNYDLAKQGLKNAQQVRNIFTDSRDGKTYRKVKIGTKTWMAENLNYNANSSKCYDNKESNCDKYGRLYNWNTAMKSCPNGWHLPTETEWKALMSMVGGEKTAGKVLKAKNGWDKNGNGTDEFGFTALPGGYGPQNLEKQFYWAGGEGLWWTSIEYGANGAYYLYINYHYEGVQWGGAYTTDLYSVRCIKN